MQFYLKYRPHSNFEEIRRKLDLEIVFFFVFVEAKVFLNSN